jgi:hypothetical protein
MDNLPLCSIYNMACGGVPALTVTPPFSPPPIKNKPLTPQPAKTPTPHLLYLNQEAIPMSGDDAFPHLNHDTPKAPAPYPHFRHLRRAKPAVAKITKRTHLTLSLYSKYLSSNQPYATLKPANTQRKPLQPSHFQDPIRPTTRPNKNARTKPLYPFLIIPLPATESTTSIPPTSEHQAKPPQNSTISHHPTPLSRYPHPTRSTLATNLS